MSSKLFIHVEPEARLVPATAPDFVEVSRLPIDVGQRYLVQATGRSTFRIDSPDPQGNRRLFDAEALLLNELQSLEQEMRI